MPQSNPGQGELSKFPPSSGQGAETLGVMPNLGSEANELMRMACQDNPRPLLLKILSGELHSPLHRLDFEAFIKTQYLPEVIEAYLSIDEYREKALQWVLTSAEQRNSRKNSRKSNEELEALKAEAALIMTTYFKEGSSREVKISDIARKHILRNIELRILPGEIFVEIEEVLFRMLEAQLPQFLEEVARLLRSGPPPASGGPMFRPRSSTNSAKHRPIALPGKIPIPQPAPNPSDGMRVSLTPSSEEPPELPFSDSPIRSENTEGSGFSARRHSRNVVLQILNGELPPPLTRQALESFTKQEFCYELIQYHDAYVAYCALASKIYTGSFSSLSDTDSNESLNKQTSDEHKGGSGLDPHASDEDIERVALEAERMASMFFGDDAPCELNITDSSRKGTLANLAAHNYHPFVFRTAHEQVIHSLQTSVLPRFVSEAQRTPTNVTSQDPSGLSVRRSTGEADVPGASPNVARMSRGKEALLGAFKDFKDTIKGSPSRKPSRGKVARDKSGDSGETNNNSSSGPEVRGSSGNEVRLE